MRMRLMLVAGCSAFFLIPNHNGHVFPTAIAQNGGTIAIVHKTTVPYKTPSYQRVPWQHPVTYPNFQSHYNLHIPAHTLMPHSGRATYPTIQELATPQMVMPYPALNYGQIAPAYPTQSVVPPMSYGNGRASMGSGQMTGSGQMQYHHPIARSGYARTSQPTPVHPSTAHHQGMVTSSQSAHNTVKRQPTQTYQSSYVVDHGYSGSSQPKAQRNTASINRPEQIGEHRAVMQTATAVVAHQQTALGHSEKSNIYGSSSAHSAAKLMATSPTDSQFGATDKTFELDSSKKRHFVTKISKATENRASSYSNGCDYSNPSSCIYDENALPLTDYQKRQAQLRRKRHAQELKGGRISQNGFSNVSPTKNISPEQFEDYTQSKRREIANNNANSNIETEVVPEIRTKKVTRYIDTVKFVPAGSQPHMTRPDHSYSKFNTQQPVMASPPQNIHAQTSNQRLYPQSVEDHSEQKQNVKTEIVPEVRTKRVTRYIDTVKYVPVGPESTILPNMQVANAQIAEPIAQVPVYNGCEPNCQQIAQKGVTYFGRDSFHTPGEFLQFNPKLSEQLLDDMDNPTGDVHVLRKLKKNGELRPYTVTLGGRAKAFGIIEGTDVADKFGLLARFPGDADKGVEGRDVVLSQIAANIVVQVGDWVTLVAQPQYSDLFFDEDPEIREIYALVGDPNRLPFYGAFGRKAINFGEFNNFNPFTPNVNWHFFHAQSDKPVIELGYEKNGLGISATAITDQRQFRVALGDDKEEYSNFAIKARKKFDFKNGKILLSSSYLYDSIYRNNITVHTAAALARGFPPFMNADGLVQERNGIWDVAAFFASPLIDFGAEYTRTDSSWPATKYDGLTGEVLDGIGQNRGLSGLTLQSRIKWPDLRGGGSFVLSGVFSHGVFGPEKTAFDEVFQHVIGFEWMVSPYVDVGTEYVFVDGFQPFVDVQNASDSGVQSHALVFGGKVKF